MSHRLAHIARYAEGGVVDNTDWKDMPVKIGPAADSQAQSRFTKVPIKINQWDGTDNSGGEYHPDTGKIQIDATNPESYRGLNSEIHHEDIHALLEKYKVPRDAQYNVPPEMYVKLINAFRAGHRAGRPIDEFPAYMGAFNSSELPGVTEDDRQSYLGDYRKGLSAGARSLYDRVIASYDASRK